MKETIVFFALIAPLIMNGCLPNLTAQSKTKLGASLDGLGKLDEVSNIVLIFPLTSPDINRTPTIRIEGVSAGDHVYIYSDAQCSQLLTWENANDNRL